MAFVKLQALQGQLELGIQVIVHTLHACERAALKIPQGIVPMSNLGYKWYLCSMALVNVAATWDGFMANLIRDIRASVTCPNNLVHLLS
jgi:hypothetical protein